MFTQIVTGRLLRTLAVVTLVCSVAGCESEMKRQLQHFQRTANPDAARSYLEGVLAEEPDNPEVHFLYGKVLLESGEYAAARQAFGTSNELSPRYEEEAEFLLRRELNLHMETGTTALVDEDYRQAAEHFTAAVHLSPPHLPAFLGLGQAYAADNRLVEADSVYERALQLDPRNGELINNLAELKLRLGRFDEVLLHSGRQIELFDPANDDRDQLRRAYERMVYALVGLDRYEAAGDTLSTLVELFSPADVRQTIRDFAVTSYNQGRISQAVPWLRLAVRWDSSNRLLRALNEAYRLEGDYESMRRTSLRLLTADRNDVSAMKNLIEANEMLGFFSRADSHRVHLLQTLGAEGTQ